MIKAKTAARTVSLQNRSRKKKIFYYSMMAWPVLQFLVFWVGVNVNSIFLAFQEFNYDTGSYIWVGFAPFGEAWRAMTEEGMLLITIKNSLVAYVVGLLFGIGLGLLFSYYIYKKYPGSGVFKFMLFLPSIISSVVLIIMFKFFVENAIPYVVMKMTGERPETGLISNSDTAFGTVLFYSVWVGFGANLLMYVGAMTGISESVVEAAKVDGITPIREFFQITLPLIYPTVQTFVVVGIAGLFTNQLGLYSFYGTAAPTNTYTFGYYLFRLTAKATQTDYPYLSATGLMMTCIAVPLTLGCRKLMTVFGPKVI